MGPRDLFLRWGKKWRNVGTPVVIAGSGLLFWFLSQRKKKKDEENECEQYMKALSACMKEQQPIHCQHELIDLQNCVLRAGADNCQRKELKPIGHTSL